MTFIATNCVTIADFIRFEKGVSGYGNRDGKLIKMFSRKTIIMCKGKSSRDFSRHKD